ncbi:MAG: hypothetical protein ABIH23_10135, partial [bacterium]
MTTYRRIPPDEYPSKFQRCSVCGQLNEIGKVPEGGQYDSPSPVITGCTFTVYGRSAIQLAGQANGSVLGDGVTTAPSCSPILLDLNLTAGKNIVITTSGGVGYNFASQSATAEGNTSNIGVIAAGDQNGISDITAPYNALLGVFTTDDTPGGTAPTALDFTLLATRD